MAEERMKRDVNYVPVIGGVTDDTDKDIAQIRVNPITKRLLIDNDVAEVGIKDNVGTQINPAKEDGNLASLKQENDPYAIITDDASVTDKLFVGYASAGSSEADAVWRIKCLDETGTEAKTGFAEGVTTFTKVWNNRTGYNYS